MIGGEGAGHVRTVLLRVSEEPKLITTVSAKFMLLFCFCTRTQTRGLDGVTETVS